MYDIFQKPKAPKGKPVDKTFVGPTKEDATTGRFMPGGDHYGVGHRQPVGHKDNPKQDVPALPRTSSRTDPDSLYKYD